MEVVKKDCVVLDHLKVKSDPKKEKWSLAHSDGGGGVAHSGGGGGGEPHSDGGGGGAHSDGGGGEEAHSGGGERFGER